MGDQKYNGKANLGQYSLSREEYLANCAKGGRKGSETLRRKKAMKELARQILDTDLSTEDEIRAELEKRGIEQTEAAAVLLAQLRRARTGDTEAARFLRDTSGQKPVDNVAIGNLDDKPFETLDLSKLTDDQLKSLVEVTPESDPPAL